MKREILLGVCCAIIAGCGTSSVPLGADFRPHPADVTPVKGAAPTTPTPTDTPTEVPTAEPTEAPAMNVTVTVRNFEFSPATITVAPGTTVTWQFEGPAAHTSTSDEGSAMSWDSGLKQPGESFSQTFDQEGTYSYHCTPHPRMMGTVTVSAEGADTGDTTDDDDADTGTDTGMEPGTDTGTDTGDTDDGYDQPVTDIGGCGPTYARHWGHGSCN